MAENVFVATDSNFDEEVLKSDVPVLVDFWAEWCGPCRMLSPTVEALAGDYEGKVRVAKLNVDENGQTAQAYGIRGIPTLLLFKSGQVQDQIVGNTPRDNIERVLQKHIA
jgi:thioredoxin 1